MVIYTDLIFLSVSDSQMLNWFNSKHILLNRSAAVVSELSESDYAEVGAAVSISTQPRS